MAKYTLFNYLNFKDNINKSDYFSTGEKIIMGILNITEDSFYDGGKYLQPKKIISQVEKMLDEGASIIDIGAQSTKPNAISKGPHEECKILLPAIKLLRKKFKNIFLSTDTYWSLVAEQSIKSGANMINDVSAGNIDPNMLKTISKLKVPYILMHMQGRPENMQNNPNYKDVVNEVYSFFEKKIKELENLGFNDIIIDPGLGFGKNLEHNYTLLNNLHEFKKLNYPILVGASRKSMIYKLLNISPEKALNGTSIINTVALKNGADILRVHDVKEAYECVKIINFMKNNK